MWLRPAGRKWRGVAEQVRTAGVGAGKGAEANWGLCEGPSAGRAIARGERTQLQLQRNLHGHRQPCPFHRPHSFNSTHASSICSLRRKHKRGRSAGPASASGQHFLRGGGVFSKSRVLSNDKVVEQVGPVLKSDAGAGASLLKSSYLENLLNLQHSGSWGSKAKKFCDFPCLPL